MKIMRFRPAFVLAVFAATIGSAGDEPSASAAKERSSVYVQTGLSSGTSGSYHMAGATLGGTLSRNLGSRLALEATGAFLNRGFGENGLNLSASLLVNLRPTGEKVVAYFALGGGVYRASFDTRNPRLNGPMTGYGMGSYGSYGMMGGYYGGSPRNYGQMPMFYGNRMNPAQLDQDGRFYGRRTFTDPAVTVGGGIKVDLGSHLSLRPDVRALVIMSGGDSYTVGLFTLNFGYRF